MLDDRQRIDRYISQTGRTTGHPLVRLTPRQARRTKHKLGHQLAEAVEEREERSAARQMKRRKRAEERRRSAALPKPSR